jgi:hypothetical protein
MRQLVSIYFATYVYELIRNANPVNGIRPRPVQVKPNELGHTVLKQSQLYEYNLYFKIIRFRLFKINNNKHVLLGEYKFPTSPKINRNNYILLGKYKKLTCSYSRQQNGGYTETFP